jgi:threonine synthase
MDIQVASNFERYLYYHLGCDSGAVRKKMQSFADGLPITVDSHDGVVDDLIRAGSGNTAQTLSTIRECYNSCGVLLDPHTAVGYSVGQQYLDEAEPMIFLATAHPAKFGNAIRQALGDDVAHHPRLDKLSELPSRYDMLDADSSALKQYVIENVNSCE